MMCPSRKKTTRLVVAILALFLAAAATNSLPAQALGFGAPSAVNSNATSDALSEQRPYLAQGNGVWIAVWDSADTLGSTIGSDFDIIFSRSLDGGMTWSTASGLNSNASSDSGTDISPSLATDGAGNWVAVWMSTEALSPSIGTDQDIFVARSSDDGATWSAPATLNTYAGGDASVDGFPKASTDGVGNWTTVWFSSEDIGGVVGSDNDVVYATSTDNGATWSAAAVLNSNATTDSANDTDIEIAMESSGNAVCVWLTTDTLAGTIGTDGDIVFARSTDSGVTWGATTALGSIADSDSGTDLDPTIETDGSGRFIVAWETYEDLGGTIGLDADIFYVRSTDGGATWSATALLNANAAIDSGSDLAPSIVTDGAGEWLAVWQSNEDIGGVLDGDYDIVVSNSNDNGTTWSSLASLTASALGDTALDNDPQIATAGLGEWAVIWLSNNDLGGPVGGDVDILVSTSSTVPVELSGIALE